MTGRKTLLCAATGGVIGVICAGSALTASAGPSANDATHAAKSLTVQVHGRQIPTDQTNLNYRMTGDLLGIWRMTPVRTLHDEPTLHVEAGLETFDGCVDLNRNGRCGRGDAQGRMRTAYLYWVSFDHNGRLVEGQCVHPVIGGRRAFAGARGVITMHDRPVGDEVRTTYQGTVTLNAELSGESASSGHRSQPSTAAPASSSSKGC